MKTLNEGYAQFIILYTNKYKGNMFYRKFLN